jgi:CHAD domain-containing protein
MGNRRAMPKQQNISQAHRRRAGGGVLGAESRVTRLLRLTADFNAVLDKCSVSAEVEEVHRTRTGSRRIQAIVETMLREGGVRAIPLKQAAQPWLRQLKRLRRKAGSVRDLDVQRKLLKKPLAEWIERSAAAEGEERAAADGGVEREVAESGIAESGVAVSAAVNSVAIPEADRLRNQAARLDAWLKHERQVRVEALKKHLEKHRQKLAVHEIAFLAAADRRRAPSGKAPRRAVLVALDDFARLAHAMPMLGANNLHEFRKSVKKARYVAEAGGDDRSSQTVAEALKRLQDAIGVWHDWLCLTREAQTALGSDGGELTAWLAIETGGHFTQALAIAGRLRGELLGEWMAARNQPREWQAMAGPARKNPSRAPVTASARISRAS